MRDVGIIGAGVAGLQLALFLQRHGLETTLYSDRTPEQLRADRLPSLVVRFDGTCARERALGVDHWDVADFGVRGVQMYIGGAPPLDWTGFFQRPASAVDLRIYQATLLEDFVERGGKLVMAAPQAGELAALAGAHELLVVASGRGGLAELFPRDPQRSPHTRPQRRLLGGFFRGVDLPDPLRVIYTVVPGQGELFQAPFRSFDGPVCSLLLEAIPGQAFEPLTRLRYEDDPRAFDAAVLALVREHAPPIYAHVRPREFGATRALDVLQGAITPTARRGWVALGAGKFALALGDTHVLNDPILAQGANTASRCAAVLGEALLGRPRLDEAFCRELEGRLWENARAATEWTNATLGPPSAHSLGLFQAAARSRAIADELTENFNAPERNWEIIGSSEGTAAFLTRHGQQRPPQRAPVQ